MPQLPEYTSGFKSKAINEVIDYCKAITPIPSKDHTVTFTSSGALLRNKGGPDGVRDKFHFELVRNQLSFIDVHSGNWIRHNMNGTVTTVAMSVDVGSAGTYSGIKYILIPDTGYIVLTLDDPMAPTSLTVDWSATWPTTDYTSIKWVLGKVTCVGLQIDTIEQYWTGDVGSAFLWTDTAAQAAGYTGNIWKSITINSTGTLSLFGFEGATDDHAPYRLNTAGVKSVAWVKTSGKGATCTTAAAVAGTIANGFCADGHTHTVDPSGFNVAYATNAGTAENVTNWPDPGTLDHGALGGLTDDDHSRYLDLSGAASRNGMSGVIGDNQAIPKSSINPSYRYLVSADGSTATMCWDSTTANNSWWLKWNGTAENFWTYDAFNLCTYGSDGVRINGAGAGKVQITAAGAVTIDPYGGVSIAPTGGDVGIAPTDGHVNLHPTGDDKDVIINPSGTGGAIVYGSTDGVTLGEWTHKGGLIGTGIVRKRVEDLSPTDVVLCIPGGAT